MVAGDYRMTVILLYKGAMMRSVYEIVLWSIAFPGFGQILNGRIGKGILFLGLEFLINIKANINEAIVLSFNGHITESIKAADYQWIMFYPCVYMFAIWDAFRDADGGKSSHTFLISVFGAYFGTLGVVFSRDPIFHALLLGPVWLGLLGMILGAAFGYAMKAFVTYRNHIRYVHNEIPRSNK